MSRSLINNGYGNTCIDGPYTHNQGGNSLSGFSSFHTFDDALFIDAYESLGAHCTGRL